MGQYEQIGQYFSFLQRRYHLQICIKDYCGFIPINRDLDEVLRPFLAHTNPFCMYIKSDIAQYHNCQLMIRKMHRKCQSCEGFFGFCHAGLGEYVIPISYEGNLLGSINLGFFQTEPEQTCRRIAQVCGQSALLEEETAQKLYRENIRTADVDLESVLPAFRMVAEYLGYTYRELRETHQVERLANRYYSSSEDTIISHAIEHIRQHYNQKITARQLADCCHRSTTYLSRVFKKRTGVNINIYINKVRIEISKHDLLMSASSIADIALNSGFNDPNYYCRVFNQLTGISPSEFRRRFHKVLPGMPHSDL